MSIRNIQLVSRDEEYINKILGKLVSDIRRDIQVEVYTNEVSYEQYLEKPHKVDVLFIDEMLSVRYIQKSPASKVFVISEKHNASAVCKFDGATGLLRVLGEEALEQQGSIERKCKVVNVVSTGGRCGKTTAAIGIAYRLSQLGRRVLYIDAEYSQNYYEVIPVDDDKKRFADVELATSMMNLTTESFTEINKSIEHDVIDYLPPFEQYIFSYHLSTEDLYKFATTMANRRFYDYIVVECGADIGGSDIKSVFGSDRVVIVTDKLNDNARLKKCLSLFDGYKGEKVIICQDADTNAETEINCPVAEVIAHDDFGKLSAMLDKGYYKKAAEAIL